MGNKLRNLLLQNPFIFHSTPQQIIHKIRIRRTKHEHPHAKNRNFSKMRSRIRPFRKKQDGKFPTRREIRYHERQKVKTAKRAILHRHSSKNPRRQSTQSRTNKMGPKRPNLRRIRPRTKR